MVFFSSVWRRFLYRGVIFILREEDREMVDGIFSFWGFVIFIIECCEKNYVYLFYIVEFYNIIFGFFGILFVFIGFVNVLR